MSPKWRNRSLVVAGLLCAAGLYVGSFFCLRQRVILRSFAAVQPDPDAFSTYTISLWCFSRDPEWNLIGYFAYYPLHAGLLRGVGEDVLNDSTSREACARQGRDVYISTADGVRQLP